ncbi:phosphate propanoyltransferase [Geosporobacter ferrireducens]|uniref:Phosphate propanoyltransferase n=1 Tax=Geosporobacter ferrireducens TaxID=1424294 RepID=A0A1D8GP35_9FIRM|nr:phosphate propanoyltransferase [Geosporobacter ferrireducens]AOT72716.1 propanediol utilization protein [Geosporobacter ferrireducens]MTI55125.1 phosphate propanoyltransferase [Geosporobacter ferrireducens]
MIQQDKQFVEKIVREVLKRIDEIINEDSIPIGVSNRHIHLSKEDLNTLFGQGYQLTKLKDLKQPGQYAAVETVKVVGKKGSFDNVRILGPVRDLTQLEISFSDGYILGLEPPVRESGKIGGTPSIKIIGPKGEVQKDQGVIAALRHIHVPKDYAIKHDLKDKNFVNVVTEGLRKIVFYNVLVRVSDQYALEMHVDTDEANAGGLKTGNRVKILKD